MTMSNFGQVLVPRFITVLQILKGWMPEPSLKNCGWNLLNRWVCPIKAYPLALTAHRSGNPA